MRWIQLIILLHATAVRNNDLLDEKIDYSHGTVECGSQTATLHIAIICHGHTILILECCLTSSSDCPPRVLLQGLCSLSPPRVASASPSQFWWVGTSPSTPGTVPLEDSICVSNSVWEITDSWFEALGQRARTEGSIAR